MIIFDPLWRTMKEKKISQYRLINYYGFSAGQLSRMRHNENVSTHTIGVLCTILNCSVNDIMEFCMDNSENAFPTPDMFEDHIRSLPPEETSLADPALAEAEGSPAEIEQEPLPRPVNINS